MDQRRTVEELTTALHRLVEDTNIMWRDGVIAEASAVRDGEVWRAGSGDEWLDGTADAAEALQGQGCRWSLHDLVVLARSDSEATASYRIVHEWGDGRPAAQALFLETWRRGADARWRLARHAAEKV